MPAVDEAMVRVRAYAKALTHWQVQESGTRSEARAWNQVQKAENKLKSYLAKNLKEK